MSLFPRSRRAHLWDKEKISALATRDVEQLRSNAEHMHETEIAELCTEVLNDRPRGRAILRRNRTPGVARRLVSRSKAFSLRGVVLENRVRSRGGVRAADGTVVVTVWADDVQTEGRGSAYLLWAPNLDGSRPWSDKPAGRERLQHCRLAAERGHAEGILVYGVRREGVLLDDEATSVDGADPLNTLDLRVQQRGDEYWATWDASPGRLPSRVGKE